MLGSSVAATALALLALVPSSLATTIPLRRRDTGITNADGSINIEKLDLEASHLAKKYERTRNNWKANSIANPKSKISRKSKRGVLKLTTQDTAVWTGTVTVGTPAQTLNIYFDSGSSDFTIASSSCPSSSCGTKNRYTVAKSTTAVKTSTTVTTNFVDGTSSSGALVEDTVHIAGLVATSQDIIAATSLSSTVSDLEADGMGLAYPSLSQAFSASLPFTLYSQNQGGRPQNFAMLLKSSGTSEITFGAWNRAHVGAQPIKWFNVLLPTGSSFRSYWQIGASLPYLNGSPASTTYATHIIDSGTTFIVAPPSAAAAFYAQISGAEQYSDNYWTFPCATPPDLSFSFARVTNQLFSVSAYNFNLGYLAEDPTRCVGAVIGQNLGLGTSWILGDAFMMNWYIIHDVAANRIGIAQPR
ncbi:hypothetical protein JCM8547_003059 [Rhodosporidiobolus lusitaniae]